MNGCEPKEGNYKKTTAFEESKLNHRKKKVKCEADARICNDLVPSAVGDLNQFPAKRMLVLLDGGAVTDVKEWTLPKQTLKFDVNNCNFERIQRSS